MIQLLSRHPDASNSSAVFVVFCLFVFIDRNYTPINENEIQVNHKYPLIQIQINVL